MNRDLRIGGESQPPDLFLCRIHHPDDSQVFYFPLEGSESGLESLLKPLGSFGWVRGRGLGLAGQ